MKLLLEMVIARVMKLMMQRIHQKAILVMVQTRAGGEYTRATSLSSMHLSMQTNMHQRM